MELAEIPHGHHTVQGAKRKDRKRIAGANGANEVLKQTRFAKRQAKRVQEQDAVRLQRRRCCLAPYFQE